MTRHHSVPQLSKAKGILPFIYLHCSFLVPWLTLACPSEFSLEVTSFKDSLTPVIQLSQTGLDAPPKG